MTKKQPATLGKRPPQAPPAPAPTIPAFVRVNTDAQRAAVRPSTKRDDYEGGWQRIVVPSKTSVRVFSTTRRWRGVDVYIARPTFVSSGPEALIRIKIYAIVEGMDRVLVASGIYRFPVVAANILPSTYVCGVRAAADRFDVELSYNEVPNSPGVDAVDVGVIATDELVGDAALLGAPFASGPEMLQFNVRRAPELAPGDPGYEIVSVQATMAAGAAPRWLHIHDSNDPAGADIILQPPVFSFGFPAVGWTLKDASDLLRTYRFRKGIVGAVSTLGAVTNLAPAGDVIWQIWFR